MIVTVVLSLIGCKGWKDFGFNRKQQIRQCIMIPVCCLIIALICTFL